jgi:large subunit ribosomal protein L25
MEFVQVAVERREKLGTAHSRRLRAQGKVPAVLYGLGRPNADLVITQDELHRFLKTGSRLVELRLGDKAQQAILRDVQHDPLSDEIVHIDLARIDEHHEIETRVPLEFKGVPKGLAEGGVFETVLQDLQVRSTPARLPKLLTIDVSGLKLNDAILVKDLTLPEGVKVLHHKPDDHVAHCVPVKVEEPVAAVPAEGEVAEPERIGGKKPEEEGAAAEAGGKPAKEEKKDREEKKEKK